jgi:hypothetical protein
MGEEGGMRVKVWNTFSKTLMGHIDLNFDPPLGMFLCQPIEEYFGVFVTKEYLWHYRDGEWGILARSYKDAEFIRSFERKAA